MSKKQMDSSYFVSFGFCFDAEMRIFWFYRESCTPSWVLKYFWREKNLVHHSKSMLYNCLITNCTADQLLVSQSDHKLACHTRLCMLRKSWDMHLLTLNICSLPTVYSIHWLKHQGYIIHCKLALCSSAPSKNERNVRMKMAWIPTTQE